jgi:predicted SnoaL-like aldol condensation-catalyzing enzyme
MSDTNRKLVEEVYRRMAAGDVDGLADLLHPEFVSHNPRVPHDPATGSGKDAFVAFFRAPAGQALIAAGQEIKRMLADGDLVAIHVEIGPMSSSPPAAAVDILRIQDGLLAEHWDAVQPVPENPANPHGMF